MLNYFGPTKEKKKKKRKEKSWGHNKKTLDKSSFWEAHLFFSFPYADFGRLSRRAGSMTLTDRVYITVT